MKGSCAAEMIIPPLFRCPISLDLLRDPVTLCTGQTYDRSFIEKWLAAGNSTCPVTMQKLQDSSMVPNRTLRHLIDQWLQSNNPILPHSFQSTETDYLILEIKKIIESDGSTLENKLEALEQVHSLSQELPLNNNLLIELNFFGLLVEQIFRNRGENPLFVEKALSCALKLMPFSELSNLNLLNKQDSKFDDFIFLFEQGNMLIKKNLCLVVEAISSGSETKALFEKLGKSDQLLEEIVHLVQNKGGDEVEAGIRALSALSLKESNHENLVKKGAVEGLIAYISNAEKHKNRSSLLAAMAMSAIENLLTVENGKEAVVNHPLGLDTIVKMVFRVSDHEGSESAVNCLLIICSSSKRACEEAIFCGVLTQLLLLLQSQCIARTKTKARMLLKLLRSMWIVDTNHHAL